MSHSSWKFEPVPGVTYMHDYGQIFRDLGDKPESERLSTYRSLCKKDLFFLLCFVMGKHWMNGSAYAAQPHDGKGSWAAYRKTGAPDDPVIGGPYETEDEAHQEVLAANYRAAKWWADRCYGINAGPETNTLDLWFRGGGKTTCLTVGETIQDILNNPEIKVCLLSYNKTTAATFMSEVKQELEGSELLLRYFPDILWANVRKAPVWSQERITVKRRSKDKEATVEAYGLIDNQPTGRHYDKLMYDDCVREETVATPGMLAKVSKQFKLSDNLTIQGGYTRRRIIGTRYSYDDLYGELITKHEEEGLPLHIREFPVFYEDATTKARRTHLITAEEANAKLREQGSFVFNCQMLLEPLDPSTQFFSEDGFTYWTDQTFAARVPGFLADMPKYCLIDPSGWSEGFKRQQGCDTGMVVVAEGPDGEWYVLEAFGGRFNPTETINHMYRLKAKWGIDRFGIEDEKLGQYLRFDLDRQMQSRGYLRVDAIPNDKGKKYRIEALQPKWERKEILLHPSQRELELQIRRYGFWQVDILDALSHATLFIPGRKRGRRRRNSTQQAKAAYSGRNRRGSW